MRSSFRRRDDRSPAVALWLFFVAALVLAMVVVGGATRLTDSGLSITEWRPISGALPPMNAADWEAEFANYRRIPQFAQMNPTMTVDEFRFIYWWEWSHRQLGRFVGLVFVAGFIFFLARRMLPGRLFWRCLVLLALGGFQGFIGWWMVSSGLTERVSVAPERLMVHLALALVLFGALVWTALDAWSGKGRDDEWGPWSRGGAGLTALIFFQALLGGLVAANDAGLIYNDWPLMNGDLFPTDYWGDGLWSTLAHNQASVQLHHRLAGYLIFILLAAFMAGASGARRLSAPVRTGAFVLGGLGMAQVALGIATLMAVAPLGLSIAHQFVATVLYGLAVWFTWRAHRDGN